MKKLTLLTYLLIVCIGASIIPSLPALQPDPDKTIIEPHNDEWKPEKR